MTNAYQQLKKHLTNVELIGRASSLLGWDQEVMMPPEANEERSKILATLSAISHEKATDPKIADLIEKSQGEITSVEDKRNLGMIKENYLMAVNVPEKLVYELSELQSKTVQLWQEAKPQSDWKAVQPSLEKLFALIKERSQIYAGVLDRAPYDAQLYCYARGNSQKVIDPLFSMLKEKLPPLAQEIIAKQKALKIVTPKFPVASQEKIARILAEKAGFNFNRGRLDIAAHPFSGGTYYDSRITTRYSEENPMTSLYGVMHETGHALYSQNLPKEWEDMPVGMDTDLSLHESQSLITEKQAGLNGGFIAYLYGLISEQDKDFAASVTLEQLKDYLYRVQPSYIRVDADEATYPLHVVLRYEIEKKLFDGSISISDIPELWNAQFKEFFGIDVPEHRFGCMQDIHWFWGMFGYFPTYTQGALYAAQLFAAMKKDLPQVEQELAQGNFTSFNGWLYEKIRSQGQFYDAPDLIERATGNKPNAQYFLDHLRNRYL